MLNSETADNPSFGESGNNLTAVTISVTLVKHRTDRQCYVIKPTKKPVFLRIDIIN